MRIIHYRNWKILLDDRPSFAASPPSGDALICDQTFHNSEIATAEAKSFVDKSILREQARNELDDWLEVGLISMSYYQRLDEIIAALARVRASDHLECAQKQPQQQPENHQDSSP